MSPDHETSVAPHGAILIIEQDAELRGILAELLGDGGYAVTCVESNDAALAALPELPRPCLLITDIADRTWDDAQWAFFRLVKAEHGPAVTIAAVSNSLARALNRPAELAGALPMPFDLEQLFALVRALSGDPAPG
jgi:CheY-like chemotaxis protein